MLIFDIGANIGNKVEKAVARGLTVVCVEPQSECVDYIKNRYKDQLNKTLFIEQCCVGEFEGEVELAINDQTDTISSCSKEFLKTGRFAERNYTWSKKIKVKQTTLNNLIKKYGKPEIIKIDVENYEYEVLKGLSQLITYIIFEYHLEFPDKIKKCIEHLNSLGDYYYYYTIGEDEKLSKSFRNFNDLMKEIMENKDKDAWGIWGDIHCSIK